MKRIISLLLFSMALVCICNRADANTGKSRGDDSTIKLSEVEKNKPRPRSIISIPIECYYSEGEIYISGEDSISGIEATVTNLTSNVSWSAESNNNYLQMSVSSASGDYYIVITLADGREYEGYYTLP